VDTFAFILQPRFIALAAVVILLVWLLVWFRRKSPAFCPPRNNRFMIWLMRRLVLPLSLRYWDKIEAVEIDDAGRKTLEALRGQRVALCPNHPNRCDSDVMFRFSSLMNGEWNFMAAREVFDPAPVGWLLQSLGCYSVLRGTRDNDAFRMTRELLKAGKRWLVLFPEGETCGQNDTVGLFQPGVAQFACWALEDLAEGGQPPPPLYLAPIALKYLFTGDMRPEIDRALSRLEKKLGLRAAGDFYDRMFRIGETILTVAEREYGARPAGEATFNERVQAMKEIIVSKVAEELDVTMHMEQPLLDRIRVLFNALDRVLHEEPAASDYARQVQAQRQERLRTLYKDLWRVLRFVATYDGYVRETMTVERFMDVIIRLEWELFNRINWHGPRKVLIRVGAPIDLAGHWQAYRENKRGTVTAMTARLEASVREMIAALLPLSTPLQPIEPSGAATQE